MAGEPCICVLLPFVLEFKIKLLVWRRKLCGERIFGPHTTVPKDQSCCHYKNQRSEHTKHLKTNFLAILIRITYFSSILTQFSKVTPWTEFQGVWWRIYWYRYIVIRDDIYFSGTVLVFSFGTRASFDDNEVLWWKNETVTYADSHDSHSQDFVVHV